MEMITVEEALQLLATRTGDWGVEMLNFDQAVGRVLRENIIADRSLPPYDRVTMDGIAIQYESFKNGQKTFKIEGIAPAGAPQKRLEDSAACLEVMTGAIMPQVADTVIRYEDVVIKEQTATLASERVKSRQNIHFKGEDRQEGDILIHEGQVIRPAEIGICATVGKSKLKVSKLPRALIVSTGDELVDIDQFPKPHQVRKSNVYTIKAMLEKQGLIVDIDHLPDDYPKIIQSLDSHFGKYQVILLSGGVSKGKFDYVPKAMDELGVKKLFYKVQQRPGKPFWFGKHAGDCHIFALPGNPISSFLCTLRYFDHWLGMSLRRPASTPPTARLVRDVVFKPDLTYFLEVKLHYDEKGNLGAEPAKGNGSGDLANLVNADAFIELPQGREKFNAGESFPCYPFS